MEDKQCFKCEHYCAAVNLDMRWCELNKSMETPCDAYKEVIKEPVYTSATTISIDNFKNGEHGGMNNRYEFYTFESFEADFNTKKRPCVRHKQAEEKLVHQILAYGEDFVIIAEMFNDKYMYRILEKKVSFTDLYENYEWTDGTPCGHRC